MREETLAQIGYEAAAKMTGCEQPWADANQMKWQAAADAVVEECAAKLERLAQKGEGLGRDSSDFTCAAWFISALKGNAK